MNGRIGVTTEAVDKAKPEIPEMVYCEDVYWADRRAEAILLLTEWEEFRSVD